jgi:bifunctional non-homologous end joining protein LigD
MTTGTTAVVAEVDGRTVRLTNLDKVFWPALELTKGWLLGYYDRMADAVLAHTTGHPVTLHRFPDGVDGSHWYQTRAPAHPAWVETVTFRPERTGKVFDVVVLRDRSSLLWAANSGAIEVHPYLGTADALEEPRAVVFDLDPGAPAGMREVAEVALRLRAALSDTALESFVKTSGNLGLHVYVPLNRPHTYEETKAFARRVASGLEQQIPEVVVTNMARRLRTGKVLVDWSQNDAGKSTVAPYSLRGNTIPTASIPLTWREVERVARRGDPSHLPVTATDAIDRWERLGDLFAPVATMRQTLPQG